MKTTFAFFTAALLMSWVLQARETTSLLQAIQANDLPQVKELVAAGADVNTKDENRAIALMWAAYKGDMEMIHYLIAQGADYTQKGVMYLNKEKTAYYGNLTGIAAGEGKLELLKYLIEDLGIDVNDKEYNPEENEETGWTAVQWAASQGNEKAVLYLINKQANVNLTYNGNWTFLHYAARNGIAALHINDHPIEVSSRGLWQYPVQLLEGENQFLIEAVSQSGKATTDTVKLTYQNQTISSSHVSRTFLLVIAIDKYHYEDWSSLNMPMKDARDLVQTLQTRYTFTEIDTLFNEAASRENVRQSLKKLIGTTTPNDQVFIYFAGHGELDKEFDEEGYWVLSDGRLSNESTSIVINKMSAKHVLIMADACFSGSLYLQRGEEEERKQEYKSRYVIASGRLGPVADQMSGQNNSPFAHFVLDYLRKSKDHVYADELAAFVSQKVTKVTHQEPIAGPIAGDEGGLFIFRLKKEE